MVTPANGNTPGRTPLKTALDKDQEYIRFYRSLRTFRTYRPILRSFGSFCRRSHMEDVAPGSPQSLPAPSKVI
jgi:hypothetical protein